MSFPPSSAAVEPDESSVNAKGGTGTFAPDGVDAVVCAAGGVDSEQLAAWEVAQEAGVCLHCRGELGFFVAPADGPFCCRGCRAVYELIHGCGLARYYDLQAGRQAPAVTLRSGGFAWLDRELEDQRQEGSDRPFRLSLDIQGVHCAACIWLLEELFRREAGGLDLKINPTLGKVDLVWDPSRGDLRHYLEEIEKFGYRLGSSRKGSVQRSRGLLLRMAVTIALALNVMMFSVSYYFGLAPEDGDLFRFFGVLNFTLASVAVVVGGQVFFQGALAGLRRRMAHLDLPIAMGIVLAYGGSAFAYFSQGPRAAYFDSLTIFIALMLVGRWSQEHILERNRNSLLDTAGADRLVAKRVRQGRLEAVSAPDIETGDELWIAPGDLMPVEGLLMRRPAQVSLDWITGESERITYEPGDAIPAGAFNAGDGGFAVAATQDFSESRLHDLLRGQSGRADDYRPRWWTWVGSTYVAAVLVLASLGFALWVGADVRRALEVTIAILVVTCPCALGLATPLAQELLHHALRKRGVFLRRPGFLDRALAVRKILLDKTGTLTMGELALDAPARKALWRLGNREREVLWNMSVRSNHPVSQALSVAIAGGLRSNTDSPTLDPAGEAVREIAGGGLEWEREGEFFRLGRADFAGESPDGTGQGDSASKDASPTVFSLNGITIATFTLSEALKADAASEVGRLEADGYELHLLSGDSAAKVAAAAERLGIRADRARGELDPEAKAELVRALDDTDTLMVGDGLNDSPSFEAALCTATPAIDRPVLPGKADFYFLGDGVAALRRALGSAHRLRQVVRDNLVVAVVYNLAAVGLCLAGLVTPVIAAILMPLSSVGIVSLTAYRLSGRRLAWMS
jgi:Cu2+-exporting ATPase